MKSISLKMEKERRAVPSKLIGTIIQTKVVDLDKMIDEEIKYREENGLSTKIQINPVSEKKYFEPSKTLTWYQDELTGIHFGIPSGFHKDGNVIWRKIPLGEKLTLDISKRSDCQLYVIIKWHPCMVGSPIPSTSEKIYEIYDEEKEAAKSYELSNNLIKGLNIARKIPFKELPWLLRALNIGFEETSNQKVLRALLFGYVQEGPTEFITFIKSKSRNWFEVFKSAEYFGIIKQDANNGFMYKMTPLGMNETDVIVYLQDNSALFETIKKELESKDIILQAIAGKEDPDEDDTEI